MPTTPKIKIMDAPERRRQLDALYERATREAVAVWAIELAKHTLHEFAPEYSNHETILTGYRIHEEWRRGLADMATLRKASFAIHRLAKAQTEPLTCASLRVVGQAVAAGHMKEHGMVASDYAIKCCNLAKENSLEAVQRERDRQIQTLLEICGE